MSAEEDCNFIQAKWRNSKRSVFRNSKLAPSTSTTHYVVRDGRVFLDGVDVTESVALPHELKDREKNPHYTQLVLFHIGSESDHVRAGDSRMTLGNQSVEHIQPPSAGEKLLHLFLSKEHREYLPGDLAEEFAIHAAKRGLRYAKVWYWTQVCISIGPVLWGYVRKLLSLIFFDKVFDVIKSIF